MLLGRVLSVAFALLPAVDVADGRAVRLVQGEAGTETTCGARRDAALAWQADGAEWIHLVDLDAALDVELYRAVTGATTAPVIASGGISTIGDLVVLAEAAAAGANLEGSIVGQALYAGRFTLPEPLEAMPRIA